MKGKSVVSALLLSILLVSSVSSIGSWVDTVKIKDFYLAINAMRTDPRRFSSRVRELYINYIDALGNHKYFNENYADATVYLESVINYLNTVTPVPALTLSRGLTRTAWQRANYMASVNNVITVDSLLDNVRVYGALNDSTIAELKDAFYTDGRTAEIMVLNWIIDNKDRTSTSRRNILMNPEFKFLGVGIQERINSYFVDIVFTKDYDCFNCEAITDSEEERMFWNEYLRETWNADTTDGHKRLNTFGNTWTTALLLSFSVMLVWVW